MKSLSSEEIQEFAAIRGIYYQQIEDSDPLTVRTKMAIDLPLSQETLFDSFADPVSHTTLFSIIKSSTPPIREGLEGILKENEFFAFEHVEEGPLNPRIMLLKYTLDRPNSILKEGVTDPFIIDESVVQDKKKAVVNMQFEPIDAANTRFTTESSFAATTGAVFARGFIDSVWLNFYERMLVANGQISDTEMFTK